MPDANLPTSWDEVIAKIREARDKAGLSQRSFAEMFELTQNQIWRLEQGLPIPQKGKFREIYNYAAGVLADSQSKGAGESNYVVQCPSCGENTPLNGPLGFTHCGYCGCKLGWKCLDVQCGGISPISSKFCGKCGKAAPVSLETAKAKRKRGRAKK